MDPRAQALRILRSRIDWGESLEETFDDPAVSDLSSRDRRLLTELVYGVLRNLKLIDYQLQGLSNRPLTRIHPLVLWILRIALYQLGFLRTPAYAAVSHSVTLVRRIGQAGAAGFVNAVLREYGRRKPPTPNGSSVQALAVRYSHPEWLVRRYCAREGVARAEQRLRFNNLPPEPIVWVNPFRTTVEEFLERLREESIACEVVPALSGAVAVQAPAFVQHPLYVRGHCFFMSVASQQIAGLCRAGEADMIVDLCAAPGNKSFVMAADRRPQTVQLAVDVSRRRLQAMTHRKSLCDVPQLPLIRADCETALPLGSVADLVLLDVACTGIGTVRNNPDIRWTVDESDLARMAHRQRRMLEQALRIVRPGGRLLYATCSSEAEENEDVVESVVKSQPGVTVDGDYFKSASQGPEAPGYFAASLATRLKS